MNLQTAKCSHDGCTNKIGLVYSAKYDKYLSYGLCWYHIGPFEKNADRLELHDHHKDVPPLFCNTNILQIPNERIKDVLSQVNATPSLKMNYSYLFHGTTGAGKSRAAWWIAERFFERNYPMRFEFLSPRKLDSMLIGSFENGVGAHEKAIDYLCKVPMLIIDDLGKERITPRMETDIFAIIDERMAHFRHTIVTTNFNSHGLIDRFPTKETATALIRRMREGMAVIGTGLE
jgi:DNA replication protein DnaC